MGASGVWDSTHRHIDSSKGRQSGMLGWEGFPARNTHVSPEALGLALVSPTCLLGQGVRACSPGRQDGMGVMARANILCDVVIGFTRCAQQGVVGFADSQKKGA